jgi:chemotaxis response regulator CheB
MENLPLINDYFVELKVLASTFTNEDKEKYEQELEEYESQLESMERMGLDNKLTRPMPNIVEPDFKSMWINMGAMVILNFTEEWDKKREQPVIIIEYTDEDNSALSQMQINILLKDWIEVLKSFGARFK